MRLGRGILSNRPQAALFSAFSRGRVIVSTNAETWPQAKHSILVLESLLSGSIRKAVPPHFGHVDCMAPSCKHYSPKLASACRWALSSHNGVGALGLLYPELPAELRIRRHPQGESIDAAKKRCRVPEG